MFITREGSHGWSAKQTKQKCSSGKNCAENTLDIRNIRAKSNFSTKVAEPHQKPTELQRRWTAVLVTQQARQRKPQPPGIDGRMQLLKTSLISPKEDFWTTSQENSEAPTRNERNKDEREIGPFNQSIGRSTCDHQGGLTNQQWKTLSQVANKTKSFSLACHLERTRSAALHYKKSPWRIRDSKANERRSVKQSTNSLRNLHSSGEERSTSVAK